MKNLRSLLIIDDDETVRTSLEMYFEDLGVQVFPCETAEEGIKLLKHHRIEGAIVDLRLPGMDGITMLTRVSSLYPETVFVILTGSVGIIIPEGLFSSPRVSSQIFLKPLFNLGAIKEELLVLRENLVGTPPEATGSH